MVYISYPIDYYRPMLRILESETFHHWLAKLRDRVAVARINARIRRLSNGHFGDCKYLRQSFHELRVDHGPGYRVYFTTREKTVVMLLVGGSKDTQNIDIERAIQIAEAWRSET
jgi:putative addiction module killer protein